MFIYVVLFSKFADLVTWSISKYASPCTLNWGHKQNIFTTTFVLQTSFSNNYAINFFPRLDRPSIESSPL